MAADRPEAMRRREDASIARHDKDYYYREDTLGHAAKKCTLLLANLSVFICNGCSRVCLLHLNPKWTTTLEAAAVPVNNNCLFPFPSSRWPNRINSKLVAI